MNQRGMTLIEILIVLTIVAAMAAFLVPRVFGGDQKAKVRLAQTQISQLSSSLQAYYTDCGTYPSALAGLISKDECANWGPEAYANKKDLKDPWGGEFEYESKGQTFVIRSLGRDKAEGGDGFDKDLSSEE